MLTFDAGQAPTLGASPGLLKQVERVRRTRQPVLVTRFGKPVAEAAPPTPRAPKKGWLGVLAGSGAIHGDIVAPASDEHDWEALG